MQEAVGSKRPCVEGKKRFVFSIDMPDDWVEKPLVPKTKAALVQLNQQDDLYLKMAHPFSRFPIDIQSILQVQNPMLYTAFHIQKSFYADETEAVLYRSCKRDQILPLCSRGLDFETGFFGRGIYFTDEIAKANESSDADPETGLRCMLVSNVIVGRQKEFLIGQFDRSLFEAPEGFNSVKGFVRHGFDYVVYNKADVYIAYVILYRSRPGGIPPPLLPPGAKGLPIVFITPALAEFLEKLRHRVKDKEVKLQTLNNLIKSLLKREMSVKMFLVFVGQMMHCGMPPDDLIPKLEAEMAKSNLP